MSLFLYILQIGGLLDISKKSECRVPPILEVRVVSIKILDTINIKSQMVCCKLNLAFCFFINLFHTYFEVINIHFDETLHYMKNTNT